MGTTPNPVPGAVELVAKKRGFDLDRMERVSEEVKVTFVPVKDFAEATERIGGDEAKLVNLLNIGLRREALKNAKASHEFASGSVVGSAKTVNQFVNAFRLIAPFNSMQDRKAQTAAVWSMIKGNSAMLEGLKTAAAQAAANEEDEEDEES